MLKNYGVEFSLQSKKILNKQKQTNLKRYGTEHPSGLKEFQKKTKQTNLKKYGAEHPSKLKEFQENKKETMVERYGVENFNYFHITNFDKWGDVEFIKENFLTDKKTVKADEMMEFFNIKSQSNIYLRLKTLDIDYTRMGGTSHYEQEIYEFLRFELGILNIIQNDRQLISPFELDFFLPDYEFAIEFDGIFWHSEQQGKNKDYHLNKTISCEKEGVQLIHIFENEWANKKEIIKSILKAKLYKLEKLCGARQTKIREITVKESGPFLNKNHRQGTCGASVKLGAFYKDKLVSVMTFSKPSISKGRKDTDSLTNFELARFASLLGYNIPGMASKFLAYFRNNYLFDSLLTFADRRYSDGTFYKTLGFELTNTTKPCYWYAKNGSIELKHRFKFRKSELSRLLEVFNPDLTEYQNMIANDYDRIFDCGNYRFVLKTNLGP
jgi:very-short-patch-repair endonuclease